jgi:hypothetical protein
MTEQAYDRTEPRQLPLPCLDHTTPLPVDIPVDGGWGYTREGACIITDDREAGGEDEPIGLDFEFAFVEQRLIEELNAMPLDEELTDVQWKVQTQEIERGPDGRFSHDHLTVLVTAFLKRDRDALDAERRATGSDRLRDGWQALRFMNICEFWFDVSRVKGIPDDAEFSMRISRGRILASHERDD